MAVYYGVVRGDRIVLDAGAHLADGTLVEVRPRPSESGSSEEAFKDRLRAEGLLAKAPARRSTSNAQERQLIIVKGEPLSQTIIAERR